MRPFVAAMLVVALASHGVARADEPEVDPLEQRLDDSGLSDAQLAATTEGEGRVLDVELELVSDPPGLGLLATRQLELGGGTQRPLCRAPCTTWLERGSYQFVVETRRGRDRAVAGTYSLFTDGQLELRIESRLARRAAFWAIALGLVGGGLATYFTQRHARPTGDPDCIVNCTRYTGKQRGLMTFGGLMVMFGGIGVRYAIVTRDVGHVTYHPARRRAPHVEPE